MNTPASIAAFVVIGVTGIAGLSGHAEIALKKSASRPHVEASAVYAAAIPAGALLRDRTLPRTWTRCFPEGTMFNAEWREVAEDFRKVNGQSRRLVPILVGDRHLLSPTAVESLIPNGNWRTFYKRYGVGRRLYAVSGVGFDRARRRALVYVTYSCGPACGEGKYTFLERVNDRWQETIIRGVFPCMWVS